MPKDRSTPNISFDRSRASPYTCSPKNTEQNRYKNRLKSVGDEKEWEEARCPICMEHPHNAVLLRCSSHGCRPYMCDTSNRHSNCFDQFCKSSATNPSTDLTEEVPLSGAAYHGGIDEQIQHVPRMIHGRQLQPKLLCPLCRGQINGWIAIKPARSYMDSKPRSCSLETCDFSGTYSELRKHARLEHPFVRPSEVDPRRQSAWVNLERERDFQDILSTLQLESGEDWGHWTFLDEPIEDNLDAFRSEFQDEWYNTSHMEIRLQIPLSFLEMPFSSDFLEETSVFGSSAGNWRTATARMRIGNPPPVDSLNETSVSGSSGASSQSRNWRTTARMRVGNPPSPRVDSVYETSVPGSSGASSQSRNWRTTATMRVGNPPSPRVDSVYETSVPGSSGASSQSRNWRTTATMRVGNPPSPRVDSLYETSVPGSYGASSQSRNWRTTATMRVGNPPSPRVDSLYETSVPGSYGASSQSRNWRTTATMRVGNPPSPRVDSLYEASVPGSSEASSRSRNRRTTARMRVGALPRGRLASRMGGRGVERN